MGLRCLFGHSYGDTRTETEREQDGEEVIVTTTEIRECQRCGETTIVSESKEVTSVEGPRASPDEAAAEPEPEPATDEPIEPDVDVVMDDESVTDDTERVTDDAELIDEEPSAEPAESEEDPQAWPEEDTTHPADATGSRPDPETGNWPDPKGDDEGIDAETLAVEAESAEPVPDTPPEEDVEFVDAPPETAGVATNGAAVTEAAASQPTDDGVASRVDLSAPERETKREYFCPDCGHAETVGSSSMRKGDNCPECLRGYIDERPLE